MKFQFNVYCHTCHHGYDQVTEQPPAVCGACGGSRIKLKIAPAPEIEKTLTEVEGMLAIAETLDLVLLDLENSEKVDMLTARDHVKLAIRRIKALK